MALSFTKIFKKDKSDTEETKLAQQPTATEDQSAESTEKKAKKHGEPGVCCGSCS